MKTPDPLVAGALRVVWQARGDRLGHRVELVRQLAGTEQVVQLLESIDAATDRETGEDWPASPPLTDWHLEVRGNERVLMAVGRAGRSHWSVVFTVPEGTHARTETETPPSGERQFTAGGGPPHSLLMPGPDAPAPRSFAAPRIVVDIACRASERPVWLGSCYQVLGAAKTIDATRVEVASGVSVMIDGSTSRLIVDETKQTLRIEPVPISENSGPQTARWRYEIGA